jgi:hypothetical protein
MESETFVASRCTSGNHLFPTVIVVSPQCVKHIKSRWFGRDENTMNIEHIASVNVKSGILWADIRIESSGGSDPVHSTGHWKKDADRIRDLIEQYQEQLRENKK